MKTLKLFRNLLIIFVAFYIFSEIVSAQYLKNTYSDVSNVEIADQSQKIEIEESKATKVNGYIEGKVTNTQNESTENKYIKVDCYSKYDNYLGTEYAKIGNLENGQSNNFKIKYKFEDVENLKISITDQGPEDADLNLKTRELTRIEKMALIFGGLIVIYYMPVGYLFGYFPL